MLTRALSFFVCVTSFFPLWMAEWHVNLCTLFTLTRWTINWVSLGVDFHATDTAGRDRAYAREVGLLSPGGNNCLSHPV